MTTSTRIYGNHNIVLTLKKSTGTATGFGDDCKGVRIGGEDKDAGDLTFAEVDAGSIQDPVLKLKFIQSTASTSLHQFLLDNQGALVEAVYAPHGNATASATQPHFKVTNLKIEGIPEIGGDVNKEAVGYESEVELKAKGGTLTKVTS
ncbi:MULTISPECIES: hypothetical protein [unclassified Aeromicrobium]|uniref:hypothetical protein n=1 Tax=unclassified Aeromicrobium TaxID=2633570 RepID=UPI00288B0C31|nr:MULTISPECIES: hypothetical protein [unclassified Aeromicrobium]